MYLRLYSRERILGTNRQETSSRVNGISISIHWSGCNDTTMSSCHDVERRLFRRLWFFANKYFLLIKCARHLFNLKVAIYIIRHKCIIFFNDFFAASNLYNFVQSTILYRRRRRLAVINHNYALHISSLFSMSNNLLRSLIIKKDYSMNILKK